MEELKRLLEEQRKAFEDFKRANDAEIQEIKSKGHADPLLSAQVAKANEAIGELSKQIRAVETKAARPGAATDGGERSEEASAHRKAFGQFMRKGREDGLRDLERKALSTGSDPDGGYAVPEALDSVIGKLVINAAPMASVVNMIDGPAGYEKLINVGGTVSGWVAETAARPVTAASQLASVKPFWGEVYANPASTQRMLDDAMFNVEQWIGEEVAETFAAAIDASFFTGTGTNQPKGIFAYTLAETADSSRAFGEIEKYTTVASATAATGDELINFVHKLKSGYRQNASWVVSSLGLAMIRKLKATASDQYLWQPGLGAAQPATLLGWPVVEDENVENPAATKKIAVFGDFKRAYKAVRVGGVRVLRDPYTNKPYVHFYTTQRIGGGVEDSCAVKVLVCKA